MRILKFKTAHGQCAFGVGMILMASLLGAGCSEAPQPSGEAPEIASTVHYLQSPEFPSFSARLDFIRDYVRQNSVHELRDDLDIHSMDTPLTVSMLWQHHEGKGNPPNMTCGPRAKAMKLLVDRLGYESRLIHIVSGSEGNFQTHTFLEIRNPETKTWEIHDPDYGIYYRALNHPERVAIANLIFDPLSAHVPCYTDGPCGWEETRAEVLKNSYFEAVIYDWVPYAQGDILWNSDRLPADTVFPAHNHSTAVDALRARFPWAREILGFRTGEVQNLPDWAGYVEID